MRGRESPCPRGIETSWFGRPHSGHGQTTSDDSAMSSAATNSESRFPSTVCAILVVDTLIPDTTSLTWTIRFRFLRSDPCPVPSSRWLCPGQSPTDMASNTPEAAKEALDKTKQALAQIRVKTKPFLEQLSSQTTGSNVSSRRTTPSNTSTALAQSAIALSLGTLQVIGFRLRGKEQGRDANDPLRLQLNQCRSVLVQLQTRNEAESQERQEKQQSEEIAREKQPSTKEAPLSGSKRRMEAKVTPLPAANETESATRPAKHAKKTKR